MTNSDDKLYYSILASGSSGNATYLETAHHRILIDAGLSGKRLEERMEAIGRSLKDVEALFVTHEHSDHVQGVGVLARRYGMDVYANAKTWQAMAKKVGQIPLAQKNIIEPGKMKDFGDLEVESFAVSHDAACPQFYQMHHDNQTFCILTDTGYVSQRVAKTIENADAYLMECNHDTEMLRMGPYSWPLKQRVGGEFGHQRFLLGFRALQRGADRPVDDEVIGQADQNQSQDEKEGLLSACKISAQPFHPLSTPSSGLR